MTVPSPQGHSFLYISLAMEYHIDSLYNNLIIQTIQLILAGVKPFMSPRPYRLGQRQATTDQTRTRIINAARELLMTTDGFTGFSMEAVARQADVARMTVYYQFGSKIGLLEALCDTLASQGGMEQMASAFRRPEPLEALSEYIKVFSRFWEADRLVTRRLRGLAALDPDFEQVIRSRDERRREGLRVLVQRFSQKYGQPKLVSTEETINLLYTLIGFEFFDMLAGPNRRTEEVAPNIFQLACATLGVAPPEAQPEIQASL
jgi:AcrR family transcriptional regulator